MQAIDKYLDSRHRMVCVFVVAAQDCFTIRDGEQFKMASTIQPALLVLFFSIAFVLHRRVLGL